MSKSVFCIASSQAQASQIVVELKEIGLADNDISVLLPDKAGTRDFAHETHTKAPEGAAAGAGAGGVVGGVIGVLAGIGALAIPGLGPFIAAGPIMAALSGAALGAAVGGLAGVLVGMGIPEHEAKLYEGKVLGGNILMSAHIETAEDEKAVKQIFERSGATDIKVASEAGVPRRDTTTSSWV